MSFIYLGVLHSVTYSISSDLYIVIKFRKASEQLTQREEWCWKLGKIEKKNQEQQLEKYWVIFPALFSHYLLSLISISDRLGYFPI